MRGSASLSMMAWLLVLKLLFILKVGQAVNRWVLARFLALARLLP